MTDPVQLKAKLPPNATIGILGGGQLGRMMASAAARLGFKTIVLEPGKDCPASQVCNHHIVAAYDDADALGELANLCDVVTYEFENVSRFAAQLLQRQVPLYPPSQALEVSQDRLLEKQFLERSGIAVAPYANVETADDLFQALTGFSGHGVLKTRRFGYDGKGQHVFSGVIPADLDALLSQLGDGPFVLEKKIEFASEFSVIAVRAVDGSTVSYEPATNIHEAGILRKSIVPAKLGADLIEEAGVIAKKLISALDYVGVIGIEFFELVGEEEKRVLVNEFAPRVHNSGHWTKEACATSQFEQHIRAITGLPLGSIRRFHSCEMQNLLGDEANDISALLEEESTQVTLYGKAQARPGRKMGHFTRLM